MCRDYFPYKIISIFTTKIGLNLARYNSLWERPVIPNLVNMGWQKCRDILRSDIKARNKIDVPRELAVGHLRANAEYSAQAGPARHLEV